jgi:hypothetical protein
MSDAARVGRPRPPVSQKPASRPRGAGGGRDAGAHGRTVGLVGKRRPRLGLLPPEVRPLREEQGRAALSALRLLYREFLEAGGLDSVAVRRSHAAPDLEERKAA